MTAREPTHTRSDNSDPRVQNPDAQAIYEYLKTVDQATFERLVAKAGLPEAQLRDILDDLQADGLVTVETGFSTVTISVADDDEHHRDEDSVATDGGAIHTVADAVAGDAAAVNLASGKVWEILASQRRRKTLRFLATLYEPESKTYIGLRDLATALVQTATARRHQHVSADEYHAVYVSLCQTHAPLLAENGLVRYYERPQKVRPTDDIVDLVRMMGWIDAACDRDVTEGSA